MPVERREQVTRIGIVRVNGKPEELDGRDGGQQPSMGGTSRVSREAQARICERLGVKFPGPTRPRGVIPRAYSPRGDGTDGVEGEGGPSTNPICDEQIGFRAASGEDADGGLEAREGELCILGLHDSKEAEHTAGTAAVLHAAMAVA